MKVALAQLNFHTGNFQHNTQKIIDNIQEAESQGADLVVFPELAICGYPPRDFLEFDHFIQLCEDSIHEIATHCQNIATIVGAPSHNPKEAGKSLFNSAYFLQDGRVQQMVHKALLPTYDVFDEYRYFEPSDQFKTIDFQGKKIALTICEDLWNLADHTLYVYYPMQHLAQEEPDFAINIAASPFSYTQENDRKSVLIQNANQHQLPIFYVNHIGAQTELIFDGGSCIVNGQGEIVEQQPFFEESLETYELESINSKQGVPFHYSLEHKMQRIYDGLVLGIRDYFKKLNFQKAIVGLSGGIDSALTIALAAKALGKDHVLALVMPSKFTSQTSLDDAYQLCHNLDVPYNTVPISSIVDTFNKELQPHFKGYAKNVAEENIQARTRALLLMAFSNKFGHILLNTSNKSELAVGYGTLYGDMCGGISVLGDVYKTEVFDLSRFINQEHELIPENVITKPPTAELKEDQKDSDTLPPYENLDTILYQYIEQRKGPKEIIEIGYEEELVSRILKMVNQSEYKRYQAPPILRVSEKAFGMGRRLPIVGKYLS